MRKILLILLCLMSYSLAAQYHIAWKDRADLDSILPPSIRVYEYPGLLPDSTRIHAYCVKIDLRDKKNVLKIHYPDSATGLATTQVLAQEVGAYVAINGGYFNMKPQPNTLSSASLLIRDGKIITRNADSVQRENKWLYPTRAAFGLRKRKPDIAWVYQERAELLQYSRPNASLIHIPLQKPTPAKAKKWKVKTAIGGGPCLISAGKIYITDQEELLSAIANTNPRTAIGYTTDRQVIMLVIDGRQAQSQGVTFEQLAGIFMDFKVVEAVNLDGGGSSTLVVKGRVINNPSDKTGQRKVGSILYVGYE